MSILVENLVSRTIDWQQNIEASVLNISLLFFFLEYSVGTLRDMSKERIDMVYPCVTCQYRIHNTIFRCWNIGGTSKRCQKENQYIRAVLVLATNRRCGVCAAYVFSLAKANKSGCFPPLKRRLFALNRSSICAYFNSDHSVQGAC